MNSSEWLPLVIKALCNPNTGHLLYHMLTVHILVTCDILYNVFSCCRPAGDILKNNLLQNMCWLLMYNNHNIHNTYHFQKQFHQCVFQHPPVNVDITMVIKKLHNKTSVKSCYGKIVPCTFRRVLVAVILTIHNIFRTVPSQLAEKT